jgi:glycosyltransferase involved in cell wall biosynthesis
MLAAGAGCGDPRSDRGGNRVTRRILHVLQDASGGGVTHVMELARHSASRGDRVTVAFPGARFDAETSPVDEGIELHPLPPHAPGRVAAILRLGARADLVHAHGSRAATWALPALCVRPSVVTFHGLHLLRRPAGRAYRMLARVLVRAIVVAADRCICVAESERDDVLRIGAPAAKVAVVRNGVAAQPPVTDEEREAARATLSLDESYTVLFVGRLHGSKDPLTALRVAGGMVDEGVVLLVAGDGVLAEQVRAADVPNAVLLGFRRDGRRLLAACDVVLNTSLWEGLPLTVLEAMWAGRPVVASDVPGNREVLGDSGMLVAQGDVEGFRAALRRLQAPESRAQLARAGRERAARFSLESMLAGTDAVYDLVAGPTG